MLFRNWMYNYSALTYSSRKGISYKHKKKEGKDRSDGKTKKKTTPLVDLAYELPYRTCYWRKVRIEVMERRGRRRTQLVDLAYELPYRTCYWRKVSIEVMERRGRRHTQLVDDLKEKEGYWKLKEEELDHTLWRTRFSGRGYGLVIRRTTAWITQLIFFF